MNQLIITVLLGMFFMTGLFACINAWAGKWGPAVSMLGLSLMSFAAGLALGGSYLAIIPALLLLAVIGAVRYGQQSKVADAGHHADAKAISDAMLAEMNRNVTARKASRG